MEYGWILLRMIAVLAAVCGLAYVLLKWGVRRLVPIDPRRSGRLEVVERLGMAPKQSLFVIRAGDQYWLVASSESGLELLAELDSDLWHVEKSAEDSKVA